MAGNFFRGTTTEQDSRWGGDRALMKKMERAEMFSKILEIKVDMKKVNVPVMSKWITGKITQVLGYEDDIVIGTCINFLEVDGRLDPRKLQMQLTGFLEKATRPFMEELWALLIDAQSCPGGIPAVFLEQKKQELLEQEMRLKAHYSRDTDTSIAPISEEYSERRQSQTKEKGTRWGSALPSTRYERYDDERGSPRQHRSERRHRKSSSSDHLHEHRSRNSRKRRSHLSDSPSSDEKLKYAVDKRTRRSPEDSYKRHGERERYSCADEQRTSKINNHSDDEAYVSRRSKKEYDTMERSKRSGSRDKKIESPDYKRKTKSEYNQNSVYHDGISDLSHYKNIKCDLTEEQKNSMDLVEHEKALRAKALASLKDIKSVKTG